MLAFAEGLLLATRSGIDRKLAVDVMTQSPIGSPMLKARAPLVLDLPDEAWFDVGLMQKDVVLALDAARELRVPLPSAAAADELLTVARALGYERRDLAALFDSPRQDRWRIQSTPSVTDGSGGLPSQPGSTDWRGPWPRGSASGAYRRAFARVRGLHPPVRCALRPLAKASRLRCATPARPRRSHRPMASR